MNNEYRILWFDDNARSQQAFEKRLRSQLRRLGFGLRVEYKQSVNNETVASLCERMRVYNEFDLIMFDHKLEGVAKGAKFAAEFRKNKIYTDMIYYSSSDVDTLWTALRREKVDGVYVLNRDGMDNDLIQIVKEQIARVFDISNMRGYILQYMSQVEGGLRGLLAADAKTRHEIVETVRSDEISVAKKKVKKLTGLADEEVLEQILSGGVTFDRVRAVLAKSRGQDKDKFDQNSRLFELQKTRNVFAHRRHRIDQTTHRLFLEGDQTHPKGYSAEDFKGLRVELMELAEELEPLTGPL